jgi:hypothetical protein
MRMIFRGCDMRYLMKYIISNDLRENYYEFFELETDSVLSQEFIESLGCVEVFESIYQTGGSPSGNWALYRWRDGQKRYQSLPSALSPAAFIASIGGFFNSSVSLV